MSITDTSLITRRVGILETEIGGEVVLMSVDRGHYCGLDAIGSDVWRHLSTPSRVDRLCHALLQKYEGDAEVVRGDVLALLCRLRDEGLIDVA